MRAIGVMTFGGPEQLEVMEVPEPVPGVGDIRIRIHAAAVSPTDTLLRSGAQTAMLQAKGVVPPYIPGMDLAGTVDALGPGYRGQLRTGDPVVALVLPFPAGAYADKIVVPQESVVRAPRGIGLAAASTVLMNAATAKLALDMLNLTAGQLLAVSGSAGAVGGYAIELAKAAGLTVIADAKPEDEELIRSLGADHIVPRNVPFAEAVRSIYPKGVHGVIDGAVLNGLALPALRDGGHLAVLRAWDGTSERGISVHKVYVGSAVKETAMLESLVQGVEQGVVTPRVAGIYPAHDASQAHARLEAGNVRGRLVLDFSPTNASPDTRAAQKVVASKAF
ncbi:NADP-dependent oxidoreductase [Arthrobacter sp. LjRoot14]